MGWWTALDEQLGECRQHILMVEPTRDHQRQTFPAGLVDDGQNAELAPIMGAPFDEIIGPDMPGYCGRSRMHEPSFSHSRPRLGCFCGTFSPSRRQIRSTRLWFTDQPAACSSAVTRR